VWEVAVAGDPAGGGSSKRWSSSPPVWVEGSIQTKLISHAIRIAAFNTATVLAHDIRVHTGYARANHEAHTLIRQALTGSGDIDPHDGTLTVRLDPLPTRRATTAIAQLCEHLTATKTRYPGTDLILRYEVKPRP
jgi:hypothetical protein